MKFLAVIFVFFTMVSGASAKCISISDTEFFGNLGNSSPDIGTNSPESPQYLNALPNYEEIRLCLSVHQDTNKEFYPYLDRFLEYGKKYRGAAFSLNNLQITFVFEKDLFYAGICWPNGTIEISHENWQRLDSLERQIVVDHEIGHCLLGREHTDIHQVCRQENGEIWPLSLMRLGSHEYSDHIGSLYELFMQELFTGDTSPLFRHCYQLGPESSP